MTEDGRNNDRPVEVILEQYKLYVEMADRVSARRLDMNKFYVSVLVGLLALLSVLLERKLLGSVQNAVVFITALIGLGLCCVWWINIVTYRQLNSGKFQVIHKMECSLPFACYDEEWEILTQSRYLKLTRVEQCVPMLLAVPYFILLVYCVWSWLS